MEVASLGEVEDLKDRVDKLENELNKLMDYLHVPQLYKIDYKIFNTLEEAQSYQDIQRDEWNKRHPKPSNWERFNMQIKILYNLPELSVERLFNT